MAAACELALVGGLWRDGRCERQAHLRALDAEEQRALLDAHSAARPAERVTALLAAAVDGIGSVADIGADDVRALRIGDRDRLVLALRALLLGDELLCVFGCGDCGESLELELRVGDLLGEAPVELAPSEATRRTGNGATVRMRAATGADHERAARTALSDSRAAGAELLAACVLEALDADGAPATLERSSAVEAAALLAELDPEAEWLLEGACPVCGAGVVAAFDPISYLWTELEQRRAQLEHDVHLLALHYHWSERDIVALDPARRARYLAQLDHHLGAR